jgi:hypothetical protein
MALDVIDDRLQLLRRQPFRACFHLRGRERALVELRGVEAIRQHAAELVNRRLAPAHPTNDGKQTPYLGHPVFVAQHASATCCRTCLEREHQIPKGHELSAGERQYVVAVIMRWVDMELAGAPS